MPTVNNGPGYLELVAYPGATFRFPLVWKASGVPVDLTGCSARLLATDKAGTAFDLSSSAGGIVFDADRTTGRLSVTFPAVAAGAVARVYQYVLSVTFPDATVRAVAGGPLTIPVGPAAGGGS